jgi:DNA-binding NarL/FixJ family response regulator
VGSITVVVTEELGEQRQQMALVQDDDSQEQRVLARLRSQGPEGRRAARRSGSLTQRERIVANLAAGGLTDREIAARLHIGDRTVETHLAHVYAKLRIGGRIELRDALGAAGA